MSSFTKFRDKYVRPALAVTAMSFGVPPQLAAMGLKQSGGGDAPQAVQAPAPAENSIAARAKSVTSSPYFTPAMLGVAGLLAVFLIVKVSNK